MVMKADATRMMPLLWVLFASGTFGGLMVLGLGAKMMDAAGADTRLASLGLAGIAFGNTLGRLSVAWLALRVPLHRIIQAATGLSLMGLISALLQTSTAFICFGLFLVATGYGTVAATVPVVTRETFGTALFQRRFAVVFTAWGAAGFLAPWIGGALIDWTDSFTLPLLCAMLTCVLCWWVSTALKPAP